MCIEQSIFCMKMADFASLVTLLPPILPQMEKENQYCFIWRNQIRFKFKIRIFYRLESSSRNPVTVTFILK